MPIIKQILLSDVTVEAMGQFIIGLYDDTECAFQMPQSFLDRSENLESQFKSLSIDIADEKANFSLTIEKSISEPFRIYINNITDTTQTVSIRVVR